MTLDQVNALAPDAFVEMLGGIYEHSPWVAEAVVSRRPFDSLDELRAEMNGSVSAASEAHKLALLRAHPELAGKAAIDGTLTQASKEEQASAGLDRMLPEEFQALTEMNAAYRDRFGFPFIICVRLQTKASILAALERRLENSAETEFETALGEVSKIAQLRLEGVIS
ncbi:MAG: 2-oxo-4-hydroxy-4-carboxy-5-ureidoimidazoline decarboxylase [Pseudomonadota bacterium]